jgi:hypothetical protein
VVRREEGFDDRPSVSDLARECHFSQAPSTGSVHVPVCTGGPKLRNSEPGDSLLQSQHERVEKQPLEPVAREGMEVD